MWDLTKIAERLSQYPWRRIVVVCGAAFFSSFVVSQLIAMFLFTKPATKGADGVSADGMPAETFARSEPQIISQGGVLSLDTGDVDEILARNIFNSEGKLGDSESSGEVDERGIPTGEPVKTDLPIKLVGLIYGGSPYSGLVAIENTEKKRINSFIVGDTIQSDAKLLEIRRDRIIIDRSGRLEFALLDEFRFERSKRKKRNRPTTNANGIAPIANGPPPESYKEEGFEREGTTIRMTSEFKNRMIGDDLPKTLQDAKAEPNIDKESGQLKGFKLTRIREGSAYQKAGLQNDDIVEEINGVPLTNTAAAISLLQSLRKENNIEIRVNRGGSVLNFGLSVN